LFLALREVAEKIDVIAFLFYAGRAKSGQAGELQAFAWLC